MYLPCDVFLYLSSTNKYDSGRTFWKSPTVRGTSRHLPSICRPSWYTFDKNDTFSPFFDAPPRRSFSRPIHRTGSCVTHASYQTRSIRHTPFVPVVVVAVPSQPPPSPPFRSHTPELSGRRCPLPPHRRWLVYTDPLLFLHRRRPMPSTLEKKDRWKRPPSRSTTGYDNPRFPVRVWAIIRIVRRRRRRVGAPGGKASWFPSTIPIVAGVVWFRGHCRRCRSHRRSGTIGRGSIICGFRPRNAVEQKHGVGGGFQCAGVFGAEQTWLEVICESQSAECVVVRSENESLILEVRLYRPFL